MGLKQDVYNYLKEQGEVSVTELLGVEGFSNRTYLERVLSQLLSEERVSRRRDGKMVYYSATTIQILYDETVELRNLHEDVVWMEIVKSSTLVEALSEQALTILQFSFTEMLNNAIDHSKSGTAMVKVWVDAKNVHFTIRDYGIGIFKSIMAKNKLESELEALQELVKGNRTTDPAAHSGEGIFWTSKISDKMSFKSYNYAFLVDNILDDYAVQELEDTILGTEVYFEISKDTEKSMSSLFHKYSFNPDDILLDTTTIRVKLYEVGVTWISRSQAKKVLNGLEKFKRITFDFAGVDLIGQGFADEIFRVFQIAHPEIELVATNTTSAVQFLIDRAKADPTGR